MKNISLLLLTILLLACSNKTIQKKEAIIVKAAHHDVVQNFIETIKNEDKEKLSMQVSLPLNQSYPVPDIKTKAGFIRQYDNLFDSKIKNLIIKSNPSKDWAAIGPRSIMFDNGKIWLNLKGQLIALNYQSEAVKQYRNQLIEAEKQSLHASLQAFEQPILFLETAKHKVRIDEISNGQYRYASWDIDAKNNSKADLVLNNGKLLQEGSGGNHRYVFTNGNYKYECFIIRLGERDSPPAMLLAYKGNKQILSEDATLLLD